MKRMAQNGRPWVFSADDIIMSALPFLQSTKQYKAKAHKHENDIV